MKHGLLLFYCGVILCLKITAQIPNDSLVRQLNLSPEQKIVLKTLIWEHREEEKKRNNELKRKMYRHLTAEQKAILKRWWKRKQQPATKPVLKK